MTASLIKMKIIAKSSQKNGSLKNKMKNFCNLKYWNNGIPN